MKQFFISIQTLLKTVSGVQLVNKWKQQHQLAAEGKMESFQFPAVFIEIVSCNPTNEMSMGGGTQIYEVQFNLHLLSWMLDSGDGDFEKNLEIYDLQDAVYQALNKYNDNTKNVSFCIRTGYEEDYEWSHFGVTHMIQHWKAMFVDILTSEPINGIEMTSPMPVEIQQTTQGSVDTNEPYKYEFTP